MQERVRKPHPQASRERQAPESQESQSHEAPETQEAVDGLKNDLSDLMDEIDALLVENAQEFVESYIQAGGQ